MQMEMIEKELPKALIGWYPFKKGDKALFVADAGAQMWDVLFDVLVERGLETHRCGGA